MDTIISAISVSSSVLVAVLTYVCTKKAQRELEIRKMKIKAYSDYVSALASLAQAPTDSTVCEKYAILSNCVILVATTKAINAIMQLNEYIQGSKQDFSVKKQDEMIREVFKELRLDLHIPKKQNEDLRKLRLFSGGRRKGVEETIG